MNQKWTVCVWVNSLLVIILSIYLLIVPAGIVIADMNDPALSNGEVPRFAFTWHRRLSADFEMWARERVASGKAAELSVHDISGTEWPVYSAVFYLWATESLQEAWEEDPSLAPVMPKEYARGAIEAAAMLVQDPNHANWVKIHWGDDYLQKENLFYRMLLISGLTSYQKLLGDSRYQEMLSGQVESLSAELDNSLYGLVDDYPGECYPIDILPAIAAIRRADTVLGTDHSAFAARAIRAFEGGRLDSETQLPSYVANSRTGYGHGPARGVGISLMLIWAPEVWPETAQSWYERYERYFWKEDGFLSGVREFTPAAQPAIFDGFGVEVDAGPIIADYGTTASAFGIGATRVNGRLDQAYPLSAEALIASWPQADGRLLTPQLLSNMSDGPFIGEMVLLFDFTRRPLTAEIVPGTGRVPGIVYLGLGIYVGAALIFIATAVFSLLRLRWLARSRPLGGLIRLVLRGGLCLVGLFFVFSGGPVLGTVVLLGAQVFQP